MVSSPGWFIPLQGKRTHSDKQYSLTKFFSLIFQIPTIVTKLKRSFVPYSWRVSCKKGKTYKIKPYLQAKAFSINPSFAAKKPLSMEREGY